MLPLLFLLGLAGITGCSTVRTRTIINHTSVSEDDNGRTEQKGSKRSESVTVCRGPRVTTAWPWLINATLFPLVTLTGPWGDSLEASQKKAVVYFAPSGDVLKRSTVETKLSLKLRRPMMIAESMQAPAYVGEIFDFVWKRAEQDMAGATETTIAHAAAASLPSFRTGLTDGGQALVARRSEESDTDPPDTSSTLLLYRDENGSLRSALVAIGEGMLADYLRRYGTGRIHVQLWAETRSPSGTLLAEQRRDYTIIPAPKLRPRTSHLGLRE